MCEISGAIDTLVALKLAFNVEPELGLKIFTPALASALLPKLWLHNLEKNKWGYRNLSSTRLYQTHPNKTKTDSRSDVMK